MSSALRCGVATLLRLMGRFAVRFRPWEVNAMIGSVLSERLKEEKYEPMVVRQLSKTITAILQERVKGACGMRA